jgi:hypothetical protein
VQVEELSISPTISRQSTMGRTTNHLAPQPRPEILSVLNPSPSKQSPPAANGHKELLIPLNTYDGKDELVKIKNARIFFTVAMMVSKTRLTVCRDNFAK